jgi:hypothetical protein
MPPDEGTAATAGNDKGDKGSDKGSEKVGEEASKLLDAFKEAGIEDPKGALDTIRKLRAFEKGDKLPEHVTKELDELRTKVQEAENAKLSEQEKLQNALSTSEAARADAERRVQEVSLRASVAEEGRKQGALYPGDLWKLVDASQIEYDKAGDPTNLTKVVEELKKVRPTDFSGGRPGSFDGGARQTAPGSDMEGALRRAAGRQ